MSTTNSQPRSIHRVIEPQRASDGAGVRLKRSIASQALDYVDPFLLASRQACM